VLEDPDDLTTQALLKAADPRGRTALEIGCGDGRLTAGLARRAERTYALDPVSGALARGRQNAPRAQFMAGSGQRLPFARHSLDVIWFTLSLHHTPSPETALAEAARALAPDGLALVLEPEAAGTVQALCHLVVDETDRLEAALAALEPMRLAGAGLERKTLTRFRVPWVFENASDLHAYVRDYYGLEPDPARDRRLEAFLQTRDIDPGTVPLILDDALRLDVLGPVSGLIPA
jgi:SAM-dependent methyltransferase